MNERYSISGLSTSTKVALGAGAAIIAAGLGAGAYTLYKRKKRKNASKNKRRKKRHNHKKVKGRRYTPHTAGKRRDRSMRRIRYTSNGQPYVIMASGKARFISKKSAKSSSKRAGGRY